MVDIQQVYPGLTAQEAAIRLKASGANELPSSKSRSVLVIAYDTVREPMFLLLLSCSILYLLLGDLGEALLLSFAIFVVMLITFVQERRTERTLDALRDLSSPRALVVRDGVQVRIAGRDVAPGDLVIIAEGDRIPADGFVLQPKALKLDESLLTGESVPVEKVAWNGSDPWGQAGGDDTPFVFSGSLVVQGSGSYMVHATGPLTAIGRIGSSLSQTVRPQSALQQDTRRVVRMVAMASLGLSVAIAAVWWWRDGSVLRGVLMGLTFAMSTIPEEFPVVLTVFMALGAWRIAKQQVLTRQMNAIETLGSATCLCVDKTGTLTENRMTVAEVWSPASDATQVARMAALASDPNAVDPMDKAAIAFGKQEQSGLFDGLTLSRSFPLVRPLLATGYAWGKGADGAVTIAAKGAPETIASLCHLEGAAATEMAAAMQRMADNGYRVLGVAEAQHQVDQLDGGMTSFPFSFIGLVGFSDPVRAGVAEAVQQCHEAGIKVIMITGDYPVTALSIARQIGLENSSGVLTGTELAELSDAELTTRLKTIRVLARMIPEQKLRVVNLLRAAGEVVAMTGDGVNDAPALKAAHIGIAMGARGTDVAREAAALVLLNDDFASIVGAIRLGRRIYDNIQKAISYIIAIHVPIVGLTIFPLLIGAPPILWPVHLAFLELIIDPVCSIVFEAEPEEALIMKRPPRPVAARLFGRSVVTGGAFEGVMLFVAALVVYYTVGNMGDIPDHARAVSFATLVFGNIGLILTLRSKTEPAWTFFKRRNPTLRWVLFALTCLTGLVLYMPGVIQIFHFAPPHAGDLAAGAAVAALSLIGFEIAKVVRRPKAIKAR